MAATQYGYSNESWSPGAGGGRKRELSSASVRRTEPLRLRPERSAA